MLLLLEYVFSVLFPPLGEGQFSSKGVIGCKIPFSGCLNINVFLTIQQTFLNIVIKLGLLNFLIKHTPLPLTPGLTHPSSLSTAMINSILFDCVYPPV